MNFILVFGNYIYYFVGKLLYDGLGWLGKMCHINGKKETNKCRVNANLFLSYFCLGEGFYEYAPIHHYLGVLLRLQVAYRSLLHLKCILSILIINILNINQLSYPSLYLPGELMILTYIFKPSHWKRWHHFSLIVNVQTAQNGALFIWIFSCHVSNCRRICI